MVAFYLTRVAIKEFQSPKTMNHCVVSLSVHLRGMFAYVLFIMCIWRCNSSQNINLIQADTKHLEPLYQQNQLLSCSGADVSGDECMAPFTARNKHARRNESLATILTLIPSRHPSSRRMLFTGYRKAIHPGRIIYKRRDRRRHYSNEHDYSQLER